MSVELEIPDGSPDWWLSPNIWTVPGDDPSGAPGLPITGEQCFLYAQVTNGGTNAVQDATVRFYWADPSVGFDRTTANHVGDANVSLDAGETQDVLCLVPWLPTFVNGGHECVLAEAFHAQYDPLPASPDFNVPTDRHVAQRNLSVLTVAPDKKKFSLSFQVCNTWRTARTFQVSARAGKPEELRVLLPRLGQSFPKIGKGKVAQVGFVTKPCPDEADYTKAQKSVERLEVRPNGCVGLSVVGELEGDAALLHIVQTAEGGKETGGLGVLIIRDAGAAKGGK